ncbi:AAA family ATPase [Micromonospora echinofusca]|uniref:AAA family ATPase n=1 Tax=Micromonospora echinofusca TaxID=47858 RepID=A0ABS3VT12_MICEH|nr:AAA family ATPase [Micromonospora echinofusca]
MAVLIGLQGSGKSTFCRRYLAASHVVVSKDAFPHARHRQRRQMRLVEEALAGGRSVAVDNTNPSPAEWQPLVGAARQYGATTVGYWFPPDVPAALARNAARQGRARVPEVGIFATLKRLRRPQPTDGFDRLYEVRIDGRGGFTVEPVPEPGAAEGDGRDTATG